MDLFIDNARVFHVDASPGPFSIDHALVVTGEGQAQVVTKDILGREQLVSIPFYVSNSLLKKGLHEFSYEAGLTREDYGTTSDHYNRWFVVGSERYGVTDHLTSGMHDYRSDVILRFPISNTQGVVLTLVQENGQSVPAGATAYVLDQNNKVVSSYPVGFQGEVYLHGLSEYTMVRVKWRQLQCQAAIHYEKSDEILPYLGEFVCRPL